MVSMVGGRSKYLLLKSLIFVSFCEVIICNYCLLGSEESGDELVVSVLC